VVVVNNHGENLVDAASHWDEQGCSPVPWLSSLQGT
jgi:hypothetical protein